MAKIKSKFNTEELVDIEKQVQELSVDYDYKTKDYPFEVIINKFGEESDPKATLYVPDYQREFVWKPDRQSLFIESVLLGVPLTPFLVSEDDNNRLEIIDGSQRIRTLIAFYENNLRLRKLKKLNSINSAKFKDLPRKLQNTINNRDFKVIVVSENADQGIRKDIFERINTSSEKLTDSEIRKGAYSGDFYDLIIELKNYPPLSSVCPIPVSKANRGEYEELILRFFTYTDRYEEFKHDVGAFLNSYLDDLNEEDFDKEELETRFKGMVDFVNQHFPIGFRKEPNNKSTPRVRFEAISVGVFLALKEDSNVIPTYMEWLNSKEFAVHTTSDASNNKFKLKNRVEFVRDCLLNRITKESLTFK
jgi:hypothetical protein